MINDILKKYTELYGFCSFDDVKDKLLNCRAKSRIPDNSKSIIVILYPYLFESEKYIGSDISKYACVKDYHIVINDFQNKLINALKEKFPDNHFESFADNSPVPEVFAAMRAGLGVIGKNGLLINENFGSYVFIGEIITDMELIFNNTDSKACIGCNKCLISCPDNALSESGIDIKRCLSDITQKKGTLEESEINLIKKNNCLWGCDICQDVCPMNKNIKINPVEEFRTGFDNKMRCDGNISDRAYAWRGIAVIRRNCNIERMT